VSVGRVVKLAVCLWVIRWIALEVAAHHHRIARVFRA